jgi:biotin synthase
MNKDLKKWTLDDIEDLYRLPFNDLIFKAQTVHRENHDPNKIQVSTLMSIKTGGCPEDCKYCSQSIKYNTDVEIEKLLSVDEVIDQAKAAKASGCIKVLYGCSLEKLE